MKILLSIFIALIVLSLSMEVQTNKKLSKGKKHIKLTEKTKKLFDKTKNPKSARTKLDFIKTVIHGFLDQLELPKRVCSNKIREAGTTKLMAVMKILKYVRKGTVKPKELHKIKKYLKYPAIGDRLKSKKYMASAVEYLKKFFKK